MNLEQLQKLIYKGENDTIEFKESTNTRSLKEVGETLCGFLNNLGGYVIFGVTDKKKIIGQEVSDKTGRDINENIMKYFEPHAPVNIETIEIDPKRKIIVLYADISRSHGLYYFNKIPYDRLGASTCKMAPSRQEELIEHKKWRINRWESLPAFDFTIDDLDHQEIFNTIKDGIKRGRIPSDADPGDISNALIQLDLIHEGHINNAAVVLYAKHPSLKYPQCLVRLARFRGRDKSSFIDNQQCCGHAFKILDASVDFFNRHLPITSYFTSGLLSRVDESFLPQLALREALVNAICHRLC